MSEVRVVDRDEPTRLDLSALEKVASAPLAKSLPLCRGAVGDQTYHLTVSVRTIVEERDGQRVLDAEIGARLLPAVDAPTRLPFTDQAVAERDLPKGQEPDNALVQAHVARAIDQLLRSLGARVQLQRADEPTVLYALDGPDHDLQSEAFRLVSERRDTQAVPLLIGFLKRPEPELSSRAVGALAAIGDPRAVKPLIARVHFDDLPALVPLIDALATIGGDEAAGYLQLVASGHELPAVRDLAQTGLDHLRARQPGKEIR